MHWFWCNLSKSRVDMKVVSVFSPECPGHTSCLSKVVRSLFTPHSFQSCNWESWRHCGLHTTRQPHQESHKLEKNPWRVYLVFTPRLLACCCSGGLSVSSSPLLSPSPCLHSLTVACCMVLLSVTVKTTHLACLRCFRILRGIDKLSDCVLELFTSGDRAPIWEWSGGFCCQSPETVAGWNIGGIQSCSEKRVASDRTQKRVIPKILNYSFHYKTLRNVADFCKMEKRVCWKLCYIPAHCPFGVLTALYIYIYIYIYIVLSISLSVLVTE